MRNLLYASLSFALISWGVYNLVSAYTDAHLTFNIGAQEIIYE